MLWMQKCADVDAVREVITMEQLLNLMPVGIWIWVRERKPKTVAEASLLANDYTDAGQPKGTGSSKGAFQVGGPDSATPAISPDIFLGVACRRALEVFSPRLSR